MVTTINWGLRDYERALQEFLIAARDLPQDPRLIMGTAAIRRRQGRFEESVDESKKAFELQPRDATIPKDICYTYLKMRKYSETDAYCNLSISLVPDQIYGYTGRARNYFLQGATREARAVLEKVPNQNSPVMTWWWVSLETYERNYQAALDRLPSAPLESFSEDFMFMPWVELEGLIYYFKGDQQRARSCLESARTLLEKESKLKPDDPRIRSSLGITYAGLGRKDEATREGKAAVEMYPVSGDALRGTWHVLWLAQIYVMVGEYETAVDQLEYLLSIPSEISVPLLRIDPRWDPLRNNPRFQQLLQKYS